MRAISFFLLSLIHLIDNLHCAGKTRFQTHYQKFLLIKSGLSILVFYQPPLFWVATKMMFATILKLNHVIGNLISKQRIYLMHSLELYFLLLLSIVTTCFLTLSLNNQCLVVLEIVRLVKLSSCPSPASFELVSMHLTVMKTFHNLFYWILKFDYSFFIVIFIISTTILWERLAISIYCCKPNWISVIYLPHQDVSRKANKTHSE